MGMSANNRGPLEKELISPLTFVCADAIIRVSKLKTQAVKLAEVPRHIRRVTDSF